MHFFALGALLFLLFGMVTDDDARADRDAIVIDANLIAALTSRFEGVWQRPPTAAEREGLIDTWVREEVLYREALTLGLDRNDPVVRRRIAQKMEFMLDIDRRLPTEEELRDWLATHPDRYREPPGYAFEQIYFAVEKHGSDLNEILQQKLAALVSGDTSITGDPTLLPERLELTSAPQIERTFGPEFVAGLSSLTNGQWSGPVRSGYGLHLVRILASEPGYLPALAEVRAAVERDVLQARTERERERFYQTLRDRYDVRIELPSPVANASIAE